MSNETEFVIDKSGTISEYNGEGSEVIIPSEINGIKVKAISKKVFQGKNLTKVEFSENLEGIGGLAFFRNQLTNIIIPRNVRMIDERAFAENPITKITISDNILLGYHSTYYITHKSGENSFDNDFDDFYRSNAERAGTYLFDGKEWSME
jgi:hypothetical protein